MASLIVLVGSIIHERVQDRKEKKRQKVADRERNYRGLQKETERRLKDREEQERKEVVQGNGAGTEKGKDAGVDEKKGDKLIDLDEEEGSGAGNGQGTDAGAGTAAGDGVMAPGHTGLGKGGDDGVIR